MSAHIGNTLEFKLEAQDGTALFVRDWPAAHPTGPGVLIMHGLGEHCGRYAHVARFFNQLGLTVRTYDHRGHGQSGGRVGDVPDQDALLRDARLVLADFRKKLAAPPLLFGHSMGGLFAARFAAEGLAPLRGLILSSPALALRMSRAQHLLLNVAARLFPGVGVPNGIPSRYLSHDDEVIAAYDHDPLVHPRISARLLCSMLAAIAYTREHAAALRIPVLLLVADDDHIVDPAGSRRFFAQLPPQLANAHFYPGFYHEIFNETDALRVFNDLRAWLMQHGFASPR